MRRFAPIRLIPQPPALELRRKTNSLLSGSLKRATTFDRLLTFMVPSSRTQPYLRVHQACQLSRLGVIAHFLLRQSFSIRSSVCVALLMRTILSVV
jgi:hypothetical protein